jgi:hypothetical protein
MKLSAITLVAIASFAASQASAHELRCNITDNQNNAMVYDFVDALDDSGTIIPYAIAERSYTKNGVFTANDTHRSPLWGVVDNRNTKTIELRSQVDKGWAIAMFAKDSPNAGGASLFAPSGKIVGHGVCAMTSPAPAAAPAPAAPPIVEAAKPNGGAAPGSLSAYLGM